MLTATHWIIVTIYLALPVGALALAIWRRARRGERGGIGNWVMTGVAGLALSAAMSLIYAAASGGRVVIGQIFLAAYFAAGMLLLLKLFDAGVRWGLRTALRVPVRKPEDPPRSWSVTGRAMIASLLRVGIVATVGLPYVMSSVMTYRPKVHPTQDPSAMLRWKYERVEFRATDG